MSLFKNYLNTTVWSFSSAHVVRRVGHAFEAAGNDDITAAEGEAFRGNHDRLHTAGAHLKRETNKTVGLLQCTTVDDFNILIVNKSILDRNTEFLELKS